MAKFKIGDRVRSILGSYPSIGSFNIGTTGTIIAMDDESTNPSITGCIESCKLKVDDTSHLVCQQEWWYSDCLVLLPSADKRATIPWSQCVFKPEHLKEHA